MSFSVLIPVYKNDILHEFSKSINSVLDQTLKSNDIVIVVDGPVPDDINEYLSKLNYRDDINIFYLEKNNGLAKALNFGLTKCKHEIIFRQDADDISLNNRFKLQFKKLSDDPEIAMMSAWGDFFNESGKYLYTRKLPEKNEDIIKFSKMRTPINHPVTVFRKSAVLSVGGYPDHKTFFEDWWLSMKLIKSGFKLYNLQEVLVNIRCPQDLYKRRSGLNYAKLELNDLFLLWKKNLIILLKKIRLML